MKKLALSVFTWLVMSSICFAGMDANSLLSMSMGGVQIGSSEEYVRSIYGEPERIVYDKNLNGTNSRGRTVYMYIYGGTFKILFCGSSSVPMYVGEICWRY